MRGRSGAMAISREPLLLPREADRFPADWIVLAQWVPHPVVVHQDAARIRVAVEADSHQVPRLALVPVGRRPHRDEAWHRLAVVHPNLQTHPRGTGADG